jgi:hypothetical protein
VANTSQAFSQLPQPLTRDSTLRPAACRAEQFKRPVVLHDPASDQVGNHPLGQNRAATAPVVWGRAGKLAGRLVMHQVRQANVLLPRSLIGKGEVDVALSADGRAANVVRASFK